MENKIIIHDENDLRTKIYTIRGMQVMLDFDLAEIYGYETKNFNRQVKNNIGKFDSDFMLQLSENEVAHLSRCKIFTLNTGRGSNIKYKPYAFTEQGIYMLMTVLRGDLAIKQSKILIRQGKSVEADLAYQQIYAEAKKTIFVIDNYISLKTLVLLKSVPKNVKITIFSDNLNHGLHENELYDFIKEYPDINISFKTTGGIFHDRYIILDFDTKNGKIYHCGASSKDAGKRVCTISTITDKVAYSSLIDKLLKNQELVL